ncbi:hypothetical protein M8C21_028421, partial [Ambrosia artemisiifolia]
ISDVVDLYHAEQLYDLASVSLYINTNNTSNLLTFRLKDTLDSVYSSVVVLSPNLSSLIDLNKNQFLRSSDLVGFCYAEQQTDGASVSLYISTNNTSNVLTYDPNMIHSQATYKWRANSGFAVEDTDIIAKRSKFVPFVDTRERLRDVNRNHRPLSLKTCSGDPASAFTEPGLSHRAIVGITLGVLVLVMSHARCLYNCVYRKKEAEISSTLLRNGHVHLMPVQESSDALAAGLAGITVDKAVEFSYEELSKATNDFSLGNKIGQGGFGATSEARYAQYGDVSPKVDVYAFGVVLYELISAKKAIIRENGSDGEPKGLIALFDEVLSQANPEDGLVKMIDPRLGDNYPLDSVYKMAQLAKACTHEDPRRRPHMRSIVVALTNLSSSIFDKGPPLKVYSRKKNKVTTA